MIQMLKCSHHMCVLCLTCLTLTLHDARLTFSAVVCSNRHVVAMESAFVRKIPAYRWHLHYDLCHCHL